jgi:hypothetical protein
MLSGYLTKESAQIYLRELERINENKIIRRWNYLNIINF